jgi:hypothetical protein
LRWITIIRYPEGVSIEDGEEWFLNVHAKEALKQPGLLKFVSYRVLTELTEKAMKGMKMPGGMEMPPPGTGPPKSWVRVNEYWYEGFDAWRKAILGSPPEYTTPSWGGEYPFVDMASTFIPYYHDVDFMRGTYRINFDRPTVNYFTSP